MNCDLTWVGWGGMRGLRGSDSAGEIDVIYIICCPSFLSAEGAPGCGWDVAAEFVQLGHGNGG